jgi:thymidylate kinase
MNCLVDSSSASMWAYRVCGNGLNVEFAKIIIDGSMQMLAPDLLIIYTPNFQLLQARLAGKSSSKSNYFKVQPDDHH